MLHVDLPPTSKGGVAHQVSRLANNLSRRGHDVVILSTTEGPPTASYNVKKLGSNWPLVSTRLGRLVATPLLFAQQDFSQFDVVHAHGDDHLISTNTPLVRTFYGAAAAEARHATGRPRRWAQQLIARREKNSRARATVTVGISRTTLRDIGPLDAVVPCGADTNLYRPGTKNEVPTVLFIGTLEGRKRGQLLVDAFLREVRPVLPAAQLWMVMDEVVRGDGITSYARPTDDELASLLRAAWVYASVSSYEGFGVPIIEAMASGTVVVATDSSGSRELLEGGDLGLLLAEEELGEELVRLLLQPDRRSHFELRPREVAVSEYDWDNVTGRYEELYELAIRSKRSTRVARADEVGGNAAAC